MIEVTYQDKGGISHTRVFSAAEYAKWLGGLLERLGRIYPHTSRTVQNPTPVFH